MMRICYALQKVFSIENTPRTETITLNTYQEKRIKKAKKSIERGEYLTNEQADKLVAQWLNK